MSMERPVAGEQRQPPRPASRGRGLRGLLRRISRTARIAVPLVEPLATPVARLARPVLQPVAALTTPLAQVIGLDAPEPRPAVALQHAGADVRPGEASTLVADPSDRLVLLVGGTGESDDLWSRGGDHRTGSYGDRLALVLGWSPLTIRYDAGWPLGEGALELHRLVHDLVATWPVPVRRIVIVAHGDAGLLVRSTLGVRVLDPAPWTDRVTELITLGTPGMGTTTDAVSGSVGRRLDESLAGIVVVPASALDVPMLDHVDYLVVWDRLVGRPHPIGRRLGDLLWFRHRASRGGRDVVDLFPTGDRFEVDTRRHPLTNHPELHDALLRWLV